MSLDYSLMFLAVLYITWDTGHSFIQHMDVKDLSRDLDVLDIQVRE
jgi:hypothetical protein